MLPKFSVEVKATPQNVIRDKAGTTITVTAKYVCGCVWLCVDVCVCGCMRVVVFLFELGFTTGLMHDNGYILSVCVCVFVDVCVDVCV